MSQSAETRATKHLLVTRSVTSDENNSSCDQYDGKSKDTDAVEYSSCQHPVILHLFLLVIPRFDFESSEGQH